MQLQRQQDVLKKFLSKIPVHATTNRNICVLGVNSNRWYWIRSLFKEKFSNTPAIKLYGKLGAKRKATKNEKARLNRRMKATRALRGNTYLWQNMDSVREINFTKAEQVNLGKMTRNL